MSEEERGILPPEPTPVPAGEERAVPEAPPKTVVELKPGEVVVEAPSIPLVVEAPPAPDADLEQDIAEVGGPIDESAGAIPPPPPPPPPPLPPVAVVDTAEVSGDDKLLAALAWFTMVVFQLPILSIVLLLIEPNRNRPFQRYHAVTSIAFWLVAVIYEIVVGLAMGMLTLATLGLFAFCLICLWVVFFLPHIVALVYAFYALTGRTPEIPVISRLAREQKWI